MNTPTHHLEQLRLRDVVLLDHLAETGSLRITAERMHVTQPAITQAIQAIERAFGVLLVQRGERGQRGVSLTAAGQAALVRLRVARAEMIAAQSAALVPSVTQIRIGALSLAMFDVLPQALASLRQAMPQVRVELIESTVAGLWAMLEAGEVDAIVSRLSVPDEDQSIPKGVMWHRLAVGQQRLALVAAHAHTCAQLSKPSLSALAEQEWVLPPPASLTRQLFNQIFIRAGIKPPEAGITSFPFHSNLLLAATGQWLTVVPELAVQLYAQALKLKIIRADWGPTTLLDGVFLAYRETSLSHPALANLQRSFRYSTS